MKQRIPADEHAQRTASETSPTWSSNEDHVDELASLLQRFGEELEKLELIDGYLVHLRDSSTEHLISLKVRLTPDFRALEETYYRYKIPLRGDTLNLNARAFHSRGIVHCDRDNGTEAEKHLLKLWNLQEIAAVAMLDEDDASRAPIGSLLLLKQVGRIDERLFVEVERLISSFYEPLRLALEKTFLEERNKSGTFEGSEQSRIKQFVVDMNHAQTVETTCHVFATEMFRQYGFDGLGVFLLEDDALVNRHAETADPIYQDIGQAWASHFRNRPYLLDATDGGVSHAFVKNQPLLFHDVQTLIGLPMSEKDRRSLELLESTRTLLLLPLCETNSDPIGVLVLYSLSDTVNIGEADLKLINRLVSSFSAALILRNGARNLGKRRLN